MDYVTLRFLHRTTLIHFADASHQFTPPTAIPHDQSVHGQLVHRGRAWADHITEPWKILVYVGAYIIFSVGFDLTIFALLGDAVLAIGTFIDLYTLSVSIEYR